MKAFCQALGAGLTVSAVQANATQYAYCAVNELGGNRSVSGIIEIGDTPDDHSAFEGAFYHVFRDYRAEITGDNPSPGGCYSKDSIAEVYEDWDRDETQTREEGGKFFRTGWTGEYPAASEVANSPSKGASIAAVGNRAKSDHTTLEQQRAAAAINAKRFADAARNDASLQAQIRKRVEELKKRGSAQ